MSLGAADILVGLLGSRGARILRALQGAFVLGGRPADPLASMPAANLAARTITEAGAGVVVEPGDTSGLIAAASDLLAIRHATWSSDVPRVRTRSGPSTSAREPTGLRRC